MCDASCLFFSSDICQVCNLFLHRFEMCFGDVRRALLTAFGLDDTDGLEACENVN